MNRIFILIITVLFYFSTAVQMKAGLSALVRRRMVRRWFGKMEKNTRFSRWIRRLHLILCTPADSETLTLKGVRASSISVSNR